MHRSCVLQLQRAVAVSSPLSKPVNLLTSYARPSSVGRVPTDFSNMISSKSSRGAMTGTANLRFTRSAWPMRASLSGSCITTPSLLIPPHTLRPQTQLRFQSSNDGAAGASAGENARPTSNDLYARLGVPRTATEADIKKAYRVLALKYHPDTSGNTPEAEEQFRRVKEAYECLSNKGRRAFYDKTGSTNEDVRRLRQAHIHWVSGFKYQKTVDKDGNIAFQLPMIWGWAAVFSVAAVIVLFYKAVTSGSGLSTIGNFLLILATLSVLPKFPAATVLFFMYGYNYGSDAGVDTNEPEWAGKNVSTLVSLDNVAGGWRGGQQQRMATVELTGIPQTTAFTSHVQLKLQRGDDPSKAAVVNGEPGRTAVKIPEQMLLGGAFVGTVALLQGEKNQVVLERTWNPGPWRIN